MPIGLSPMPFFRHSRTVSAKTVPAPVFRFPSNQIAGVVLVFQVWNAHVFAVSAACAAMIIPASASSSYGSGHVLYRINCGGPAYTSPAAVTTEIHTFTSAPWARVTRSFISASFTPVSVPRALVRAKE